jgi:hypothetical protein
MDFREDLVLGTMGFAPKVALSEFMFVAWQDAGWRDRRAHTSNPTDSTVP